MFEVSVKNLFISKTQLVICDHQGVQKSPTTRVGDIFSQINKARVTDPDYYLRGYYSKKGYFTMDKNGPHQILVTGISGLDIDPRNYLSPRMINYTIFSEEREDRSYIFQIIQNNKHD